MIRGFNHLTLSVRDLERSFRFYVEELGLKPVARWAQGAYLLAGEGWVCLSLDAATRQGPLAEYSHFAFTLDQADFEAVASALLARGHKPWKENRSEGRSLYLLDPDGHKLELHDGSLQTRLAALREKPYQELLLFPENL